MQTAARQTQSTTSTIPYLRLTAIHLATTHISGKTPKQIIDEKVLLEAKRLLAFSSQLIKEIGYELGFGEPSNFVKYFIKHCGMSPAAFRNTTRKTSTDQI